MRSNIRAQRTSDGVALAVYGDITPDTATGLLSAFDFFARTPITLSVYSGGGDVFAAIGIRNRMAELDVTARVYGIAASGAAFLLTGAKRVEMTPFSSLMIHAAYKVGPMGERIYDEDTAAIDEMQVEMFAKKTGKRKDMVRKWVAQEDTFFSTDEAVELGLADDIYQPERMAASLTNYQPMEDVMKEAAEVEQPQAEAPAETPAAEPAEPVTDEVVEVEVPVTVAEAMQAAFKGKFLAKVNVAAKYGEIVAQLVEENKTLKAQLDEAASKVEALAPQAEAAAAATAQAEEAVAKVAEVTAEVEKLKATPIEEPVKVDAAPTAQAPGAPPKAPAAPVSAHAQRMAKTLEALDRRIAKAAGH